jgi:phosphoglucosamine mutase
VKKLFGTDGIRGVAGRYPLDRETIQKTGYSLAKKISEEHENPEIIIGRDTRESGPWIDEAIARGIINGGGQAIHCGIMTTPGLAFLTRKESFDAGVMISASHNPYLDNGIKIFSKEGMKLPDQVEKGIESLIFSDVKVHELDQTHRKKEIDGEKLRDDYIHFLSSIIADTQPLRDLKIIIDCANGSASAIAPLVFSRLTNNLISSHDFPDGRNINLNCGSVHMDDLAEEVIKRKADIGIAFDGDADRALAVDRNGRLIDGDHIMYISALEMKRRGELRNSTVAGTVMSNMWFENKLSVEGINLLRADVGDKYVLEKMMAHGLSLGGEQSGHIIFLDHAPTGDGILTALKLLEATFARGVDPVEALSDIVPYPQVLLNIRVDSKPDLFKHSHISKTIQNAEGHLSDKGRILIRYSGTEPLARVMIEGENKDDIERWAKAIAEDIKKHIGAKE